MVAKVGVHDDNVIALGELQAVHVRGAEPQLSGARLEDHARGVGLYELVRDLLRAVGGAVVDNNEFPVDVAGGEAVISPGELRGLNLGHDGGQMVRHRALVGNLLLGEGLLQQPGDDGQVLALVEGGQDDRIGVLGRGLLGRRHCEEIITRKPYRKDGTIGNVKKQPKTGENNLLNGWKRSVAKLN